MKRQGGWTLVATLIVVVIVMILSVTLFMGSGAFGGSKLSPRADGKGITVLGASEYTAKDDVCRTNLGTLRQSITMAQMQETDGKFPAELSDTKIGSDFYKCPVGGEPYAYDPGTGQVHCVHPGHESY